MTPVQATPFPGTDIFIVKDNSPASQLLQWLLTELKWFSVTEGKKSFWEILGCYWTLLAKSWKMFCLCRMKLICRSSTALRCQISAQGGTETLLFFTCRSEGHVRLWRSSRKTHCASYHQRKMNCGLSHYSVHHAFRSHLHLCMHVSVCCCVWEYKFSMQTGEKSRVVGSCSCTSLASGRVK